MALYTVLITTIGQQKLAAWAAGGSAVELKALAAGDGNGSYAAPSAGQTSLVNEVWRSTTLNKREAYSSTVVEAYMPANVGTYTVREMGLFDSAGDLFAVASVPDSVKTSGKELGLSMVMQISNASVTISATSQQVYAYADMSNVALSSLTGKGLAAADMSNVTQAAIVAKGIAKSDLSNTPVNDLITMAKHELVVANWTERANPKSFTLTDICWSGALLVAVGYPDGTDAYIVTSPDGITWTERANPKNIRLIDICWNGSLFVAVGDPDGTNAYIVTSPDGITWTERDNPKNIHLHNIAWNGLLFVAVGDVDGTDAYIISSPDGITWTERSNPKNLGMVGGVVWANNKWVAVGDADGTDAYIITSLNVA